MELIIPKISDEVITDFCMTNWLGSDLFKDDTREVKNGKEEVIGTEVTKSAIEKQREHFIETVKTMIFAPNIRRLRKEAREAFEKNNPVELPAVEAKLGEEK